MTRPNLSRKEIEKRVDQSKVKTGKINLLGPDEFKRGKFRVNMFVDLEIVDAFRKLAAQRHTKYQTLMNECLREYIVRNSGIEIQHGQRDSFQILIQELQELNHKVEHIQDDVTEIKKQA